MLHFVSLCRFLGWLFITCLFGTGLIFSSFYLYLTPNLPDVEQLKTTQLQIPLRVFSADRKLIAEFGEKRRSPIAIEKVPNTLKDAFIAAEDNRFYSHHGVDIKGLLRAATQLLTTGKIQSGGSTITMQVAKNFFLSREKTFTRKFNEILLALQIEQELNKPEILELYFNKIYLGNRAYGIAAAAQVYYGKNTSELSLAQSAMIAGLPKAPSSYNPIANPKRALIRRNWILNRMLDLNFIDEAQHSIATAEPITAKYHGSRPALDAPYLAEMARKSLVDKYGNEAYSTGFNVYLTINSPLQEAANKAVRDGLESYDRRHGYRGPERVIPEQKLGDINYIESVIRSIPNYGELVVATVINATDKTATLHTISHGQIDVDLNGVKWAKPFISVNRQGSAPKTVTDILSVGDVVRLKQNKEKQWQLAQVPEVQGTLVSITPSTGAIKALVGGYDFSQSKYNRALQAERQPGSNFKPFVYLAALENGSTAATLINDAPIVFEDRNLEASWRPENSSGEFYGPTRLRTALYKSRNLVSIRLLKKTGSLTTRNFVSRFGLDGSKLPADLSLALGSAGITPFKIAEAYSVLANGGFEIHPYFIDRVEDVDGNIVFKSVPTITPKAASVIDSTKEANTTKLDIEDRENLIETDLSPITTHETDTEFEDKAPLTPEDNISTPPDYHLATRVVDERSVYIMHSILKDVIQKGTGRKAKQLKRSDLAGKTGTTNDQKDAWFSGFNTDTETTVWVGFDQPKTLGRREYGATAALPIWIDYMRTALDKTPSAPMRQPEGLITVKINAETGKLATAGETNTIFEIFRKENAPQAEDTISRGTRPLKQEQSVDEGITAEDIF